MICNLLIRYTKHKSQVLILLRIQFNTYLLGIIMLILNNNILCIKMILFVHNFNYQLSSQTSDNIDYSKN